VFKGISGLGSLLKQAGQISSRMEGLNEELRAQRVTGSAGGGMVEFEVNGLVEALNCRIDPQLLTQGDAELLEDLIVGAVNQAVGKAKQSHAESLKSMTGGIELPALNDAMGKFFGGQPGPDSPTGVDEEDTPTGDSQDSVESPKNS
jgi:DNA-binding YbaB/EbfC family protein